MKGPCVHCGELGSHHSDCLVSWVARRKARDSAADQAQFVGVGCSVMRGAESIATTRSHTMAKRIANALKIYKPGKKGY